LEAFILLNTEAGLLWKVADSVLSISGVTMSRAVTGQFDVILYAEFSRIEDLGSMIEKIQSLPGVVKTQTSIVMPPTSYTLQDESTK
jgi:DNA-binding Lrp family transcriptional regulator